MNIIWRELRRKSPLKKPRFKAFFQDIPPIKSGFTLRYPVIETVKFMYYLVILLQLLVLWRNDIQRIQKFFRNLRFYDFVIKNKP